MRIILMSMCFSSAMAAWAILFASNMSRDGGFGQKRVGLVFCVTAYILAIFTDFTQLQYLLLVGFMVYLMIRRPETVHAVRWVVVLSLIPYLLLVPLGVVRAIQYQALARELFPLVSLVDRLGNPPISLADSALNQEVEEALTKVELLLDQEVPRFDSTEKFLKRVHEATVQEFIDSDGFGLSRGPRLSEYTIESLIRERKGPSSRQGTPFTSNHVDLSKLRNPRKTEANWFSDLHAKSVVEFSFPDGFGYVQDRDHVAGFLSHRFGKWPEEEKPSHQKLSRVDLVSLLLHEHPVVYLSDELPRMDQVQSTPTRPLNAFESASLGRVKKGEDLIVADLAEGWLMMGAIRNAGQCIKCHEGKRGDLLGAFSYSIRKAEVVKSYRERMAR